MYELLALITGLAIAVMISINGGLTQFYGVFPATVIIHVVGSLFALLVCLAQKRKIKISGMGPVWIYTGGVIGVLTTVFNNLSFGKISMTSIVALGLMGQAIAAIAIDSFGLFGMKKRPFRKEVFIGFLFSLAGIAVMIDDTVAMAVLAVFFSLAAGITVVLSRTVNARLADKIGDMQSSFVNHLAGLPVSILLALSMAGFTPPVLPSQSAPLWIYCGGTLGVAVVLLCNITVPKLPAFRLTLLTFVGQLFTGVALDWMTNGFSPDPSLPGGLLIAAGVAVNLILERFGRKEPYQT